MTNDPLTKYACSIRNTTKRAYAEALITDPKAKRPPNLSYMAAQAVEMQIIQLRKMMDYEKTN